jgi:HemY protein
MACELWGKARSCLESSLGLSPSPEAYALYGDLLTQLGEHEAALAAFRAGLELVSPTAVPAMPRARSLAPPPREAERKAQA